MNKGLVFTIIISLLVTTLTIVGILYSIDNMSKPPETIAVAVSTKDIQAGVILQPDMYEYVEIPISEYISTYVTKKNVEEKKKDGSIVFVKKDLLQGKEVTENIYKGEKILSTRISNFVSLQEDEGDEILYDSTGLRRMTYTAQGIQNLAGQLKAGDKIDFWLRYRLQDKENKDSIIVVDKILSSVLVVKALNSSSQEIKNKNEVSTTVELLLTQEEIQEFIKYRDLGKITLVKVPPDANVNNEKEITRKRMSMNDLIWDVLSMEEDEMNKEQIVKDEDQKENVDKYYIDENEE